MSVDTAVRLQTVTQTLERFGVSDLAGDQLGSEARHRPKELGELGDRGCTPTMSRRKISSARPARRSSRAWRAASIEAGSASGSSAESRAGSKTASAAKQSAAASV